jgi:hypothetical protein
VEFINCLNPWKLFVLPKMLENTRQARCHQHQNVVLPLDLKPNILQIANMQSIDKYVDLAYLSYLKYCVLCIFTMFCILVTLHLTIRACTVCQLEIHRQSSILAAARPSISISSSAQKMNFKSMAMRSRIRAPRSNVN